MEWTAERIARFWEFESHFPARYFTNMVGSEVVSHFEDMLSLNQPIMDYGCGLGFLTGHLLNRGFDVRSVDFSEASVSAVNERYSGQAGFLGCSDISCVNDGSSWSQIICCEVIEHLDDDLLALTVGRFEELLKVGGRLLLTTPNEEDLESNLVMSPSTGEVFHRFQHLRAWSAESLAGYFGKYKFEPVRVSATWIYKKQPLPLWRQLIRLVRPEPEPTYTPHLTAVFERVP